MPELTNKPSDSQAATAPKSRCQICGRAGAVVHVPDKAPPNRLCYRCASEYGLQDQDDE